MDLYSNPILWALREQQALANKEDKKEGSTKDTPNTKARKDEASLALYREWKAQQKKAVRESTLKERKERLKAAKIIRKAMKKAIEETKPKDEESGVGEDEDKEKSDEANVPELVSRVLLIGSPITGEGENERGEVSFSTSGSANFLNQLMTEEEAGGGMSPEKGVTSPMRFDDDKDDDYDEDNELEQSVLDSSAALLQSIKSGKVQKTTGWPEPLSDQLTEEALGALPDTDEAVLQDVKEKGKVLVRVITWNQQAKSPPCEEELRAQLFRENKFHVIVVGTEECENSIVKSIIVQSKKNWEAAVITACGDRYAKLRSHTLQATHNMVMVHRALLPTVSKVNSTAVATGVNVGVVNKQQLGNKGGIGISFYLGSTRFLFINAHLAAHQNASEKRNTEFQKISTEVTSALEQGSPFNCIFWAGDMNYRVNGTRQVVDVLLEKEMHEVMLFNDQLGVAMKTNPAFVGYMEGPLNFKPTYKFDKGSDTYDTGPKQRIPSWTDRILYKGGGVEMLNYCSAVGIRNRSSTR